MEERAYSSAGTEPIAERLKVPPQSVEAEQSVLGGLMLDRCFDQIADRITAQDFYRKEHQLIFSAIGSLREDNKPADVVTVSEQLQGNGELEQAGGLAYLGTLAKNTPSTANVAAYADIVRERSIMRQLLQVASDISKSVYEPEGRKTIELLDHAERNILAISERGGAARGGFQPLTKLLTAAVDRIDKLYQSEAAISGVPTGFADLDEMTSGLQPADLIIVAGRPSMGKTSLAMNVAENVAVGQQLPVAIFSMEMPGEQLAMRMLASMSRINTHKIRTGRLDEEDWPRVTSTMSLLAQAPVFIDDTPGLTPMELRSRARRLKREHGLGLVLVDYLQMMQSYESSENRATEISHITRALKNLANELHIPVIAMSQLNRSLEQRPNKRPVMSDLRECVTGDTLVVLGDGRRVPVRSLVGETPQVVAIAADGKLTHAKSEKVWSVGRKPVFAVRLASGRVIRATENHRLLGEGGWCQVGGLKTGDRLALARTLPEAQDAETWPERRVALLGQLVGDGSYLKGQPLRYSTGSEENSYLVEEAAREEFGASVKRYRGRRKWHQLLISGNGNRWHPAGINKWLRDLGIFGQRSYEKRIPETAFRLRANQVAVLLRHLWATDGTIYTRKAGQRGGHVIHYSTNSQGLACDVAALLLRLGIVARIQKVQKENYRPTYMVMITGREALQRFLYLVGSFGPRKAQAERLAIALVNGGDARNGLRWIVAFSIRTLTVHAIGIRDYPGGQRTRAAVHE